MMKTLGAEMSAVRSGATEIRFPFDASLTQQHGYVHAGVVTTILDSACGYAALAVAPEGSEVLSVEFKVNLLAPGWVHRSWLAPTLSAQARRSPCAPEMSSLYGLRAKS